MRHHLFLHWYQVERNYYLRIFNFIAAVRNTIVIGFTSAWFVGKYITLI